MTTAFAGEAARVRRMGHLSENDIARATGAAPSTVRAWIADRRSPTGKRAERLAELSAIVDRLVQVMKPAYVPVWMRKPSAALDDEKPLDVIAAGEYRKVSRLVSALESPVAS